jgi:hypothetical protein
MKTQNLGAEFADCKRLLRPNDPERHAAPPGQHESGYPTSPAAKTATAVALRAGRMQTLVLGLLTKNPDGLTADEVAALLGGAALAIRPRFTELFRQGLIEKTPLRRQNSSGGRATVWRAVRLWIEP